MALTVNGLEVPTEDELRELVSAAVREALPGIDVSEGPEAKLIGAVAAQCSEILQTLRDVYGAAYPDSASGILLDMVAAMTNTYRREATRSRVTVTLTIEAGKSVPTGSIVAVISDPDAQFRTIEDVTNPTAGPATFDVVCESIETGPVAAPAGTLTVIVTPVSGWAGATNVSDATLGLPIATDEELREQRIVELGTLGHGTYGAIRGAVGRVAGVSEVAVYGNETLGTDSEGRPGKTFEVVVWDDGAADDDEIAQAIYDRKPMGIASHGGTSGTATDETSGQGVTVPFTRASALRTYVNAEVVLEPGTDPGWTALAQTAVAATTFPVSGTAFASQLICALLEVPGIVAVTTVTIGTAPLPVTTSVIPDYDEIVRIASGDVSVTEA
ncbi:MAG: baseplate J/gp47 family protein [Sandaracinaceae bacterium]